MDGDPKRPAQRTLLGSARRRLTDVAKGTLAWADRALAVSWRRFLGAALATAALGGAAAVLFIILMNPFNNLPNLLSFERVLLSDNQRFSYPAVIRSGEYDGIIVGTSTMRLVPPEILNKGLDANLAAMAMNSGMAWEQSQLVDLFLRLTPEPRAVIFGLDHVWCRTNAAEKRITFRGWPEWMYDDDPWNDLPQMFNTKTLKLGVSRISHALGLGFRPQYDRSGYGVFTPPEDAYDAEKAYRLIWRTIDPNRGPRVPPQEMTDAEIAALDFPAVAWFEDLLARTPPSTLRIAVFTPIHISAMPRPGTRWELQERECKRRLRDVADRYDVIYLDYRVASEITTNDLNFWDHLHYRMPIAEKIAREIVEAVQRRDKSIVQE